MTHEIDGPDARSIHRARPVVREHRERLWLGGPLELTPEVHLAAPEVQMARPEGYPADEVTGATPAPEGQSAGAVDRAGADNRAGAVPSGDRLEILAITAGEGNGWQFSADVLARSLGAGRGPSVLSTIPSAPTRSATWPGCSPPRAGMPPVRASAAR